MILFIKIGSIVAALIIFLRFKLNLTLSIFLTTLLTIALFGINIKTALIASGEILIEAKTLQLLIISAEDPKPQRAGSERRIGLRPLTGKWSPRYKRTGDGTDLMMAGFLF